MSCLHPLPALNLGINPLTDKLRVKIKFPFIDESIKDMRNRYGSDTVMLLPCGKCLPCILRKRKEWAARCQLESYYHKKSCFITLTYAPRFYSDSIQKVKDDFHKFIKAIRNDGFKVRYYACGERGGQTGRLHIHIALFGFCPDDLHLWGKSQTKYPMYQSNYFDSIWNKGIVTVQECREGVGAYIAGYVNKKLGVKDSFVLMSTRPGIGHQYLIDNQLSIAQFNRIIDPLLDSHFLAIPRYFEKLAERNHIELPYKDISLRLANHNRSNLMREHKYDHEEFILRDDLYDVTHRANKSFIRGN